jgi:D-specific alpha-keto acid dehydrogenase
VSNAVGVTLYGCEQDEADLFEAVSPRFGVVPTFAHDVISMPVNRCISVGHRTPISESDLRALRGAGVEYISTRSIGVDHIDVVAADALGIAVENVVYAPDGVADYTLMLILMAIRNAKAIDCSARRHDFRLAAVRGRDLRDMTVGVVGVGRIGRAVITRLQGFGCRVLACNARPTTAAAVEFVSLDDLLRESDVVTLHMPLNSETHHFIGREELAAMKYGAFLINTGRGALVDTDALLLALERGTLGGAALDVLEGEEGIFYFDCTTSQIDNQFLLRLQELPNVIVTPHTAYYTARTLHDTVEQTLLNCLRFERNRVHEKAHNRDLVRGLLGGT